MSEPTKLSWRATVDAAVASLKEVHRVQAGVREIRRMRPGRYNAEIVVTLAAGKPEALLLLESNGPEIVVSRPCPEGRREFGGWSFLAAVETPEAAATAVYAGALLVGL